MDTVSTMPWTAVVSGHIPQGWTLAQSDGGYLLFSSDVAFTPQDNGWWVRCYVPESAWPDAWNAMRGVVDRYRIASRFGVDSDGCVWAIDATLSPVEDALQWRHIMVALEDALVSAHVPRGVCPVNDRPLRGSGYFSVRADHGRPRDVVDPVDFNPQVHPGIFSQVYATGEALTPASVMLPRVWNGDWVRDDHGWWTVEGNMHDMACVRRAGETLGLPVRLSQADGRSRLFWPASYDVHRWWLWAEMSDAWLVADRISILLDCSVDVEPRQDEHIPTAVVVEGTDAVWTQLPALLGPFGLGVVRRDDRALVYIPGRHVAHAFLDSVEDADVLLTRPHRFLIKTVVDQADQLLAAPMNPRMAILRGREVGIVAQLSAAARRRPGNYSGLARERTRGGPAEVSMVGPLGQKLREAGIDKVTIVKTAERPFAERERDHKQGLSEDVRVIVRDMIDILVEAGGIGESVFSAQDRLNMSKTVQHLRQVSSIKTGGQVAMYQAMKGGHSMIRHVARVAQERPDRVPASFMQRASELSGRIQARKIDGRPHAHLQVTEAELRKLRSARNKSGPVRTLDY